MDISIQNIILKAFAGVLFAVGCVGGAIVTVYILAWAVRSVCLALNDVYTWIRRMRQGRAE